MTPNRTCDVELSPAKVDAGAELILIGSVTCSPPANLRGETFLIRDADGALAASGELTDFDGETNRTGEFVAKAPCKPGSYTWLAVCPAHQTAEVSYEETTTPFSFVVKPHGRRVVVWGVPPVVECGERFTVKLAVNCSSECRATDWKVEVRDHDGMPQVTGTVGDEPWPGTAALFYTEVELRAPETEGLHAWEARAPAAGSDIPHSDAAAKFGVRAVPPPQCRVTVVALDHESRSPIEGAKVVLHPYRARTNERGVAEVRVPKGEYRLFVSGGDYFPFRKDFEVTSDVAITARLALDLEPSDAEIWS